MKKALLLFFSVTISQIAFSWQATTFTAGHFFVDLAGTVLVDEAYKFALIVDTRKDSEQNWKNFEGFSLKDGDSFVQKQWINDLHEYKTLVTGSLENIGEGYTALGNSSWTDWQNVDFGFEGGENVALVVWNSTDSFEVYEGDRYVFLSPQLIYDATQEDWQIPTNPTERTDWYLFSESTGESENPNENFALSKEVVAIPEPSTYAVVLGALALSFVVCRRK